MKYRFKYESLLKYRTFLKDEAELQFSKALARNRELNRKRRRILSTIDRMLGEAQELLSKGVTAERYRHMVAFVEKLKERVKMLEREIARSNREVEAAREKLVSKMVDVKVLERLSVRDFEIYRKQMKLKEAKLSDELYLVRLKST